MAFVSSFTPVLAPTSAFTGSKSPSSLHSRARTAPRAAPHAAARTPARMDVDIAEKVRKSRASFKYTEEARRAKEQAAFEPQRGFVRNAELLNGRLAQLGFVIGLVTELATGKGINEQLAILVAPITHLLG